MNKKVFFISLSLFVAIVLYAVIRLFNYVPYNAKVFHKNLIVKNVPAVNAGNPGMKLICNSPSITVKWFHSGNLKVPLSNPLNLKHPACSGIPNTNVVIPVFAYLIHHDKYGYFLIDTGTEASYANNVYGPMKGPVCKLVQPETLLMPDQAIDRQLSGICDELSGVFFTSLHFDHTAGLPALPDHLMMVAGKRERTFSIKGLLEPNHFKEGSVMYFMDFDSNEAQTTELGRAIDIFGDQSLWAISTPGHSKGHVSYLVNTADRPVLVAGDAYILNRCLDLGAASGTSSENPDLDQETLEKIIAFYKENPVVKLWPGHDFPKE